MSLDAFRERLERFREQADREARELKESYLALERLAVFYERLDDNERALATSTAWRDSFQTMQRVRSSSGVFTERAISAVSSSSSCSSVPTHAARSRRPADAR